MLDSVDIEGLVVFRDDEDPHKFYLLPDQPSIPRDETGAPDFLFLRYVKDLQEVADNEEAGAGFVQFRAVLEVEPVRRARVVDALRARLAGEAAAGATPFGKPITSTEPLLAAPVWTDGSVTLSTFQVSDTGLVRKATEKAPVDLTGGLAATLAVQLDSDGAGVFWSAFEGRGQHRLPISVQFDLSYQARVSARMEIHARHQVLHRAVLRRARPYRLLTEPFVRYVAMPQFTEFVGGAELVNLRANSAEPIALCLPVAAVAEAVNSTISSNEISVVIQTDQAGTGGAAADVQAALFKIATDVLSERVIPLLFGGAAAKPGENGEVVEVAESPPGDAGFDLVLDQQGTVERSIHPNGPVDVLIGSDEEFESCFKTLRLSDRKLAHTQVVATTAGVDFVEDGIAAVHVFFSYEHTDLATPGHPVVKREFDGVLRQPQDVVRWRFDLAGTAAGVHIREYMYRVDVFYTDGTRSEAPWRLSSARSLLLTPAAMGAVRADLVLTAPGELVDGADVDLRHQPAAGDPLTATVQLTPGAPRQTWFQFTGALAAPGDPVRPPAYSYRVRYRVRGSEITTGWRDTTDTLLEIGSPFRTLRTFTVRPQGSFDGVRAISGDLTYRDPRFGYTVTESFQLADLTDAHALTVGVLDGGPETVTWRARLTRHDGSGVDLGAGEGAPGTVWIGADIDFLTVQVLADLIDFETDVQMVVVELHYVDAANEIDESATLTFTLPDHAAKQWRVPRRDRSLDRYDAHIRYVGIDRTTSSETRLEQVSGEVLVLDRKGGGN
jgi:hypothetical protein